MGYDEWNDRVGKKVLDEIEYYEHKAYDDIASSCADRLSCRFDEIDGSPSTYDADLRKLDDLLKELEKI